jgi:2-iminobutanoate/2-iminopropanoate deaminase
VRAQTRQVLANIESILREGGGAMSDVLKCNVYLADIRDFQAMNEEFAKAFPTDPPARTTVQAALAEKEMLVEIEAIAYLGK